GGNRLVVLLPMPQAPPPEIGPSRRTLLLAALLRGLLHALNAGLHLGGGDLHHPRLNLGRDEDLALDNLAKRSPARRAIRGMTLDDLPALGALHLNAGNAFLAAMRQREVVGVGDEAMTP